MGEGTPTNSALRGQRQEESVGEVQGETLSQKKTKVESDKGRNIKLMSGLQAYTKYPRSRHTSVHHTQRPTGVASQGPDVSLQDVSANKALFPFLWENPI